MQKGTLCNYSPFIIHRSPELFGPDAEEFKPERWATWTPAPWTYVPFNGGPRICLGQNFAMTEMAYAITRMCQSYARIEERSGMPRGSQGYKTDIILTPLQGVKIGLIPADWYWVSKGFWWTDIGVNFTSRKYFYRTKLELGVYTFSVKFFSLFGDVPLVLFQYQIQVRSYLTKVPKVLEVKWQA